MSDNIDSVAKAIAEDALSIAAKNETEKLKEQIEKAMRYNSMADGGYYTEDVEFSVIEKEKNKEYSIVADLDGFDEYKIHLVEDIYFPNAMKLINNS